MLWHNAPVERSVTVVSDDRADDGHEDPQHRDHGDDRDEPAERRRLGPQRVAEAPEDRGQSQ
jgi:hypothetical protein